MSRPLALLPAVLVLAALLAASPAGAQSSSATPAPLSSSLYLDWLSGWNPGPREVGDALRIALDPETGTWGVAPVDKALRVSGIVPPPLVIHHPNGVTETILDPSIVDWMVVRLDANGRLKFDCESDDERGAILSAPAVSGPPDR